MRELAITLMALLTCLICYAIGWWHGAKTGVDKGVDALRATIEKDFLLVPRR